MATEALFRPRLAPILTPASTEEPDPRQSLQHVLVADPSPGAQQSPQTASTPISGKGTKAKAIRAQDGTPGKESKDDEGSVQNDSYSRASDVNPSHTMTVAHTRRNANGTIGSVYSGNKIRHLKKDDGIPLWRKDIQFAFLRAVFDDDARVFTKASDAKYGYTFAEIYIDAMARSSKTSKILKEKLLADRTAALSMAMICLLVNVGRMNTTLNFFPEMRAQLRTYHSIPSLQAHQDPSASKQLQDAPRLKSILKGASEDANQPTTIDKVKKLPIPRTNPVNLIFVLSQYAPKISETHFHPPRDFFDLVMRGTLSSRSRAKAFLWLIWFYLESDFTAESALKNPFGQGQVGVAGGSPFKVPSFDHLTEEQANAENVDTQSEIEYGEMKRQERKRILEEDETVGPPMKKAKKNAPEESGMPPSSDADRSPSPYPRGHNVHKSYASDYTGGDVLVTGIIHDVSPGAYDERGRQSGDGGESANLRLIMKTRNGGDNTRNASPAMAPGAAHSTFFSSANGHSYRRSRPQTTHQKAVDVNRKMRVEHIMHQQLLGQHSKIRRQKRRDGLSFGYTAMKRIRDMPNDYDTDEERFGMPGGLGPNPGEKEDYGEEALQQKKALDRAIRRLGRGDSGLRLNGLIRVSARRKRKHEANALNTGQPLPKRRRQGAVLPRHPASTAAKANLTGTEPQGRRQDDEAKHRESLDALDLDLLGETRDDEHGDEDAEEESGLDESEGDGEGDGEGRGEGYREGEVGQNEMSE
ncbi:MAG: hypothetical protein Q9174_000007 [Haloplaca sp. 1 TL-2023]